MFKKDQAAENNNNSQREKDTVLECSHLAVIFTDIHGKKQNDGKFRQIRRLKS